MYKKYFKNKNFFVSIDPIILIIIIILLFYSVLVTWSASCQNIFILKNKIIQIIFGFVLMIILSQIHPKKYEKTAIYFYIICLILLILVNINGKTIHGAKRWISFFGIIKFQPSELTKISIPLMLSRFLNRKLLPLSFKNNIISFLIILIPVFFIGSEPDLGTALLIALCSCFILFLSGMRWKIILNFIFILLCFIPIMWFFLMYDYQKNRITTLFYPQKDYLGHGYNIIQSKIAIGSGGLYGKGWKLGSQSKLEFLPEKHTDFIFSVLAEEFGFIGVIFLISLYLLLITRIMFISINSKNVFNRTLTSSIMLMFCIYTIVNISMVIGILPVVGVPLPLFSYGGSSLIVLMSSLGIVMSINNNKD